jgi:hypothetical protein
VIESVVVSYYEDRHFGNEYGGDQHDYGNGVGNIVSLNDGKGFFKAFPQARKLTFVHEPDERFFELPPHVLANVREIICAHACYCFEVKNSVFPYLQRFKNLEVLTVRDDWKYLEYFPQDYVLSSLHTLSMIISDPFDYNAAWEAIPRQFPELRTLRVTSHDGIYDNCSLVEPCFFTAAKELKNLERLELRNYIVLLVEFLKLVDVLWKKPVGINSVVCNGLRAREVELPDDKIEELRQFPGYQVEFTDVDYSDGNDRFYFSFKRS